MQFLSHDAQQPGCGYGGALNPIGGHAAGHNIIAPSMNAGPDEVLDSSPGGTFPSERLSCTSCHDPHGNTNFRMLYGDGMKAHDGFFTYDAPAPDAVGASIYHGYETNTKHTAYRGGVSGWCGSCHGEMHDPGDHFKHATGTGIGTEIAAAYSLYNGTDDPTGGWASSAYLALVPFEDPANAVNYTQGPTATSQVMCLTCHRAHASSGPDAGRWDFSLTFLSDDGVESGSYPIPDPYGGENQRSLCNKCHVKDLGDVPF